MEILGEETKDIDYNQFCTLLNESRNVNPSRYSSFLNNRHMSGAVQFFNQLQEDDTEVMRNFEGDEEFGEELEGGAETEGKIEGKVEGKPEEKKGEEVKLPAEDKKEAKKTEEKKDEKKTEEKKQ